MLDQQFFGASKYQPYLDEHFVQFHAVAGEDAGEALYESYDINATPTVMVLKPDGSEVDRVVGFGDADEFQEELDEAFRGPDNYVNLLERHGKNPDDFVTAFKLARKYDGMYSPEKAKLSLDLYKAILKKPEKAKALSVPRRGSDEKINLYEYTKYSMAGAVRYTNRRNRGRKPQEYIDFVEEFPSSPLVMSAHRQISSYYMSYASEEEAKAYFSDLLEEYPEEPDLMYYYVNFSLRKKIDLDKGTEVAKKMVDLTYESVPYYNNLYARILAEKGDTETLEKAYGPSYIGDKLDDLVYDIRTYARFWMERGENLNSALEVTELALANDPENNALKSIAAGIYVKMEMPDQALAVYGPSFVEAHQDKSRDLYSYANFWSETGLNLESALEAAHKAVDLSPQPYIWNALANVYWKMGNYPDAVKALDEAIDLQPSSSYYREQMKKLKEEMKKAEK